MSLVLLGTAVGGTLTALRTTIISSERDETEAKANARMLAAEDALHRATYQVCSADATMADMVATYNGAVGPTWPDGWSAQVVGVLMWGRDSSSAVESWRNQCTSGSDSAQLVTIIVNGPTGQVGKTIQVVKRD